MANDAFGIVEAARRARGWSPHLTHDGQRLVLAALMAYTGADSISNPSSGQLARFTGRTERSVRRVLSELVDLEVIAPVSDRTGGRAQTTRWSIGPSPETRTSSRPPLGDGNPDTIVTGLGDGADAKPGHGETETRTSSDRNPDIQMSAVGSSELSEKREKHSQHLEELRASGKSLAEMSRILADAKEIA